MSKQTLQQKLLEIKKRVPYLKPNQKGFNYDYANPSRVLGVFNPLFNEYGIMLSSEILNVNAVPIPIIANLGDKRKPETMREITKTEILHIVDMKYKFTDVESGEFVEVRWAGTGNNGIEQGFGSALTYSTRYFLLNYFGVPVDNEDPNYVQTIKQQGGEQQEEKKLDKLSATVANQMIKALEDGKRTPAQIRTSLSSFEDSKNKEKVEEKLLKL